jgi:hypothetical protein
MATNNLGRIAILHKGAWSGATAYAALDCVYLNGRSYLAILPGTNKNPETETLYWQLMADIGGQDLLDDAVAARDAAEDSASAAAASAAQLAAGVASPAGTFADLAALNAGTHDHGKIYITLDDGKWCYHNGSAFVAGGVYQSVSVPDESLSPEKTTYIDMLPTVNLFNKATVTLNSYLNNGVVQALNGWAVSDYIPIDNTRAYALSYLNSGNYAFYDASQTYISTANTQRLIVPGTAYYIRIQIRMTDVETFMAVEDYDIPQPEIKYVPYKAYQMSDDITLENDRFETFTGTNLFTRRYVGIVSNVTGNINPLVGYSASGFIPVTPGEIYAFNGGANTAYYDASHVFVNSGVLYSPYTIPAGVAYMRVSTDDTLLGHIMFVHMAQVPSIDIPYIKDTDVKAKSSVFVGTEQIIGYIPRPWEGKTFIAIGDSITATELYNSHGGCVTWHYTAKDLMKANMVECAKSGMQMYQLADIMSYAGVTDTDFANADLIAVMLGQNGGDVSGSIGDAASFDANNFYASTKAVIEYILNLNKDVALAFIGNLPTLQSQFPQWSYNKSEAIKAVCALYGVPFYDTYHNIGINVLTQAVYQSDTVHLTAVGNQILGRKVAAFLETV